MALLECVDRRLRTSETFTRFQTDVLHLGNAVAYLSDPRVRGLTSIDQAWIKNFNSTENLVSHILIPAAREATFHNTIDTFAGRIGGLISRWQQYDPDHQRSDNILIQTLISQEATPQMEDNYSTVIAHFFHIGFLADQFDILTEQYRQGNRSEKVIRETRRYAGALRRKVEYADKHQLKNILESAKYQFFRSRMANRLQQKMTSSDDLSNPQLAQIRNDYAVAAIIVASEQEITDMKLIDSNILIAALSDNQPNSRTARRASDELVRRCNLPDQETNIAIISNTLSLPVTPQTGRILHRLNRRVLTEARHKMIVYDRVANIAERIRSQLAASELNLYELNDLRPLMDGLSVFLQVSESETIPPADLIEDAVINEDTAITLIRTLLNTYLVRQQQLDEHGVRASLVNLAASIACGYTRQMADPEMVALIDQVRQKNERDFSYYSGNLTPQGESYNPYTHNYPNPLDRSEGESVNLLVNLVDYLTGSPGYHPV